MEPGYEVPCVSRMEIDMRSLAKTLTFACLHFGVGFGVTFALTGSVSIAAGVALIEPLVNTVVFYFHEQVWARADGRTAGLKNGFDPDLGHNVI